eukprot:3950636-Amphidinium_carterae.1
MEASKLEVFAKASCNTITVKSLFVCVVHSDFFARAVTEAALGFIEEKSHLPSWALPARSQGSPTSWKV